MKKKIRNNTPLFSIIIPVYNAEKYLNTCLNSIMNQTFKNFELIIVNDGSTDMSRDICENFVLRERNSRLININNSGPSFARSKALKIAKGEYIVYVDADDFIDKNMLENLSEIIQRHKDIDAITFRYYINKETTREESKFEFLVHNKTIKPGYYNIHKIKKEIYPYMFIIGNYTIMNTNTIYKREILLNTYCQNYNIKIGEDCAYGYEFY